MKLRIHLLVIVGLACSLFAAPATAGEPIVGLIVKTEANPFFVTMKETARERAAELGVELRSFAGRYDGDTATQVEAVETLTAAGAAGILIAPSDPSALAGAVGKARGAGLLVIALDTPFDPADTVDATFATDNFRAGELIGTWARATMGDDADTAKIVTLDGSGTQVTVEVMRNQGFLKGFGVGLADPATMYDEDDARIVGHGASHGSEEGGRAAMEELFRQEPGIDVVYAINEPAVAGAYAALKALGIGGDVVIVSVDGGCQGIAMVASGALGATAMQYPVRMARLGVEAVVEYIRTGRMPGNTPGLEFHDTGVTLVTDRPVPGIPSISSERAVMECWG